MQLSLFNNDSRSEIAGCLVEHFQGFYSLVQASDLFAQIQSKHLGCKARYEYMVGYIQSPD